MTNFITKYLPGQVRSAAVFGTIWCKAKGKNETQFPDPTAPKFSYSNCYNRVRVSQKHQQLSYNNCNAQISRLIHSQPGFGKYDVMTLDNCLPLQDPSLLAINGFAVPQTAKLAEKRKLIEEIAHNDVKKVSFV